MGRWLVGLALVLGACGEDYSFDQGYSVCALDDQDCVRVTAATLARHRGVVNSEVPPVRFITSTELFEQDQARDGELSEEQRLGQQRVLDALALLALLPEDYTAEEATRDLYATIPAFYDSGEKAIYIVSDAFVGDETQAYETLVHELVHAQQDQELDLRSYRRTHSRSTDRDLAVLAIVEGEARLYDTLANIELRDLGPDQVDWVGFFDGWQRDRLDRAAETDVPDLMIPRLFPYAWGTELMYDAWRAGDRLSIDRVFASPPESVRQVMMHPQQAPPVGSDWNEDGALAQTLVPELPDFELLGWSHDGVWSVQAMLARNSTRAVPVWSPLMSHVTADALSLHYNQDSDSTAAVWRIRMDSIERAQELAAFLEGGDLAVIVLERDVIVSANVEITANTGWQSRDALIAPTEMMAAPHHCLR
ncbi:MAG: hypothetical protein AAFU77_07920 [Myxococcota bacterium]